MGNRGTAIVVVSCWLSLLAVAAVPRAAWACSAPMDVRHRIAWSADGALLALADPEGRIVRIAPGAVGGEVLAGTGRFAHRNAAFARDGHSIVMIDEQGSEIGDCVPVSITVARVSLPDGARTVAGRAWDVAGVSEVLLSPSGARAALVGSTMEDLQVRIFDLARARAARRMAGTDALWLDEDRVAILRNSGNIHLVRMGVRGLVQVGPVPRAAVERHLLPGDESAAGFTFAQKTTRGWSIVRVRLEGPRPVLEARPWPHEERPVSISGDGGRIAAIDESRRRILVGDLAGGFAAHVASTFVLTQAVLSPDGARLGVSSHEVPTPEEDEEAFGDASAFQPTAVQVIDLAAARVVASWGAPARLTFPAFRVGPARQF